MVLFFSMIRYEDFTADVFARSKALLKFLGLPFHPEFSTFLATHTNTQPRIAPQWTNKSENSTWFSTFRDVKKAPYHWKQELSFNEIRKIQKECQTTMELFGYRRYEQRTDLGSDSILRRNF